MGTLTNSEDPDEILHCCISSGSTLFVKVKTIIRDRKIGYNREMTTCDPLNI